jgi:hypothetical protein
MLRPAGRSAREMIRASFDRTTRARPLDEVRRAPAASTSIFQGSAGSRSDRARAGARRVDSGPGSSACSSSRARSPPLRWCARCCPSRPALRHPACADHGPRRRHGLRRGRARAAPECLGRVWWAIVTMTTVGYGDIRPETNAGRVIGIVVMLFGIGFLAVLTAAIAQRFIATPATRPPADVCAAPAFRRRGGTGRSSERCSARRAAPGAAAPACGRAVLDASDAGPRARASRP